MRRRGLPLDREYHDYSCMARRRHARQFVHSMNATLIVYVGLSMLYRPNHDNL